MENNLILIEKPKLPISWNYDESVKKVKQVIFKWKTLTAELAQELWIAREMLRAQGRRTDLTSEGKFRSWSDYCKEIDSSRQVINHWLARWFPKDKGSKSTIKLLAPEGKYDVIVIDPPWPYGTEYDEEARRVASPYPEMDLEEIKNIKLPAFGNCILWLWTTHKFIKDSFDILENWGFEYKLTLAWDKQKLGMGSWLRCQVEFCLLGIKGKPEWNLTNQRDFISETRREHSRKPDGFYSMVKKLTEGRRLDYFSREERKGFVPYGDETDKFQSER